MAGDWVKMRCDLALDPAVIGIAHMTGLDEDHVVGKLHRLWVWADSQTTNGNIAHVTDSWVDRFLNVTGFAQAMISVGWLAVRGNGIVFPHFERHNGQTAKKRAMTTLRKQKQRRQEEVPKDVTLMSRNHRDESATREEKRREENKDPPNPPKGGNRGRAVDGYDPLFDRFWRAYGHEVAEQDARQAWDELNVTESLLEEMLRAITEQKKTDKWRRGKILNPGNWLRGERWRDRIQNVSAETEYSAEQRAERQRKQKEALKIDGPAVPISEVARLAQEKQKANERINDDSISNP